MPLHTVQKLNPEADTVILIHGLLGSSRNVLRLYEYLNQHGFSTAAYDQRGHGRSPHFEKETYTLSQLTRDTIEVMDALKIQKAHLVGHSLGGRVAMRVAAEASERVLSLTVLDVGVNTKKKPIEQIKEILLPMPNSFPNREAADEFLARYRAPTLIQFLRSNLRERDGVWKWIFDLENLRSHLTDNLSEDFSEKFKSIACPIHVVRGELSEHLTSTEVEEMKILNPQVEVSVIPRAGHWLHADNFEDTADAVFCFLKRHGKIAG